MFNCSCGSILLVKSVEPYPEGLNGQEKLDYERKCIAICPDCGKEYKESKYD